MRIELISTLAIIGIALGACSKSAESDRKSSEQLQTDDVAEAPSPPGALSSSAERIAPGIAVTAAPGVAFNYHYAFRLPAARVAAAQETHAGACEKLGVARCRITGMRYQVIGENDIQGQLAFKLDPSLARAFGKQGIAAIEAAEGTLAAAEITGTDAGAAITQLGRTKAQATEALARIDAQLARHGLPATERAELQRQRGDVVRTIEATRDSTAEQRESLANTPMVFDYGSGPTVRGFDPSAPLKSAIDTAIGSAQATLAFVLGFMAIFGPPAIAIGLLWLLLRPLYRRWRAARHIPTQAATVTAA